MTRDSWHKNGEMMRGLEKNMDYGKLPAVVWHNVYYPVLSVGLWNFHFGDQKWTRFWTKHQHCPNISFVFFEYDSICWIMLQPWRCLNFATYSEKSRFLWKYYWISWGFFRIDILWWPFYFLKLCTYFVGRHYVKLSLYNVCLNILNFMPKSNKFLTTKLEIS